MTDTASVYRTRGFGHTAVEIRQPLRTFKQVSEEHAHQVFKGLHPPEHSCRVATAVQHDPQHWPTFLLSFGLQQTYETVDQLHRKPDKPRKKGEEKEPDKLLYKIGTQGSAAGCFLYPRGLACSEEGDIIITDTDNNRVQVFNSAGVLKTSVGKKLAGGTKTGEFLKPTAAVAMHTGNIAICDRNNQRVQVMRPKGQVRFVYPTKGAPCAIACDKKHNLYVATADRHVKVLNKGGRFHKTWPLPGAESSLPPLLTLQVHDANEELIVCDTAQRRVFGLDLEGHLKWSFEPQASREGLKMIPVGLGIDPLGALVIGDAQNHTVNSYSSTEPTGEALQEILCPTDDLGSVQQVAVSTEGHVVVTEFTANGGHHLKIFRYLDCTCHRQKEPTEIE